MYKRSGIRQWVIRSLAVIIAGYVAAPVLAQGKKGGGGGGGDGDTSTTSYTIYKLDDAGGQFVDGYRTVVDINDVGGVIGNLEATADGSRYAAFWQLSGGSSTLSLLDNGGFDLVYAWGMNDGNEIVGYGVIFDDQPARSTSLYWPSPQSAPIPLPKFDSLSYSEANAINDEGIICGWMTKPNFDQEGNAVSSSHVAVVWRVTSVDRETQIFGPVELPMSGFDFARVESVNNVDTNGMAEVIGSFASGSYSPNAVGKWLVQSQLNGGVDVLGQPKMLAVASERGAAEAWAINAKGDVCGQFSFDVYEEPRKATVWTAGGQTILPDPAAPKFWRPSIAHAAYDLNDSGVIVGETYLEGYPGAIVWPSATTTTPVRLSDFLPKRNSPFTLLLDATAINSSGVIVGAGLGDTGDDVYGFVAVPN